MAVRKLYDNGLLDLSAIDVYTRDGPMDRSSERPKHAKSPAKYKIIPPHQVLDSNECYPINTTGKRGVCVIVNMYRPHSCKDIAPIKKLFEKLNYEVIDFDNVKVDEFLSSVTDRSSPLSVYRRISDLKSDSFIFIISSHGNEDSVSFVDVKMKRESIIRYFQNDYCPALAGKPKLFFFQNCRGLEGLTDDLSSLEGEMADAQLKDSKTGKFSHVSNHQSDIVRFYASTHGTASFRDFDGTVFLQCLIEILEDPKKRRRSFNDIQPELCRKVCEKAGKMLNESHKIGCQTPQCETTLLRHYYFCHPHL